MTTILTPTTAADQTADFTLSGTSTTLCLYGAFRPYGSATIQRLVAGSYVDVGVLTDATPAQVLTATGTFRVIKGPSQKAVGVDRD